MGLETSGPAELAPEFSSPHNELKSMQKAEKTLDSLHGELRKAMVQLNEVGTEEATAKGKELRDKMKLLSDLHEKISETVFQGQKAAKASTSAEWSKGGEELKGKRKEAETVVQIVKALLKKVRGYLDSQS